MKSAPLGELEQQIMDIIWKSSGPLAVSDVVKVLSQKRVIAYTTVMTVMGRLVEKEVLSRRLNGSSYLYQPKATREKFISSYVHTIFITAVSTLGQEVVLHFAKEVKKISPKKRKELLKILDKNT